MPLYTVTNARDIENPRVVEAPNPQAARAHVARDELTVTKCTTADAFRLAQNGVELETAGVEAEEPTGETEDAGEPESPDQLNDQPVDEKADDRPAFEKMREKAGLDG